MKNSLLSILATFSLLASATIALTVHTQAAPSNKKASPLNGKWMMTSISATSYVNTATGAITGGTGGAQVYDFSPNGKYSLYSYMKVGAYGTQTETYTWKYGTYTLKGNKVTLSEKSGKYQVKSNYSSSSNYTRPARSSDLKTETREWKLSTEDGKPVLLLQGVDSKSVLTFKKQ